MAAWILIAGKGACPGRESISCQATRVCVCEWVLNERVACYAETTQRAKSNQSEANSGAQGNQKRSQVAD